MTSSQDEQQLLDYFRTFTAPERDLLVRLLTVLVCWRMEDPPPKA